MTLRNTYAESKPLGVFGESAFSSIVLLEIEYGIEDKVIAGYEYDGKRTNIRRHKIYTTPAGRFYIRKFGRRYYLDDFLRIA